MTKEQQEIIREACLKLDKNYIPGGAVERLARDISILHTMLQDLVDTFDEDV